MIDTGHNVAFSFEDRMRVALGGDADAYNAVLKESAALLKPYLSKRLRQKEEAEDVLQEILISLHKARHTYDGKRPFEPWLFAIARYRLQDHLRKCYHDALRNSNALGEADNVTPLNVTEFPFTYESIHREIEQLPGKQPQILRLLHNEGYTAREAGVQLGMQESAVKVAAHRAYKMLRRKLGSDGRY